MQKLTIIGFGPGDDGLITDRARQAIADAHRVISTGRISASDPRIKAYTLGGMMAELRRAVNLDTAVLVSGDAGYYSIAKSIISDFSQYYDIEVVPGISSIAYFSARIKVAYDDAALVSLHGRNEYIIAKAAYNRKVFALTGGDNRAAHICHHLDHFGLGDLAVTVGERLSYPDERITVGKASELKSYDFDELSVMYVANPDAVDPHRLLDDGQFIRGDVPMTKAEIRWLSVEKLGISPGDFVYDIGAGTGSVAVEMARKAHDGLAFAIEHDQAACDLIGQNLRRHGAYNLEVVYGSAPGAFGMLPNPDKAFIGGSSGKLEQILRKLLDMNPGIRVVTNAITIQTVMQAMTLFRKLGFGDVEVACVNIAKARQVGKYDLMIAQNPVYIISGTGGAPAVAVNDSQPGDDG